MNTDVWDTLSKINVNEHTSEKGRFTYLSWTWAWATLQEKYPEANYKFRDVLWFPNETCEVWIELTVEGVTREMWLAVTDSANQPIVNPSSNHIANTRMRCLVKAIAMFGLGHYIYGGESLPIDHFDPQAAKQESLDNAVARHEDSLEALRTGLATNDYESAFEAWNEISNDDKSALWVAPSKFENAPLSTAERKAMQSSEWTEARKQFLGE